MAEIDKKLLKQIVKYGQDGFSVGGIDAWSAVVVTKVETKVKLAIASHMRLDVQDADAIIVVCAEQCKSGKIFSQRGRERYSLIDASIALDSMILEADMLGLNHTTICTIDDIGVKNAINAPDGVMPIGLILLNKRGYKIESGDTRKDINEFIHYEQYKGGEDSEVGER